MSKYEVKSVVCDYGVFEDNELKLICNSHANALKIKEILETDSDMSKPYVWQDKKIADLEAKLAESENEIKTLICDYESRITKNHELMSWLEHKNEEIKEQLAEKEKEIKNLVLAHFESDTNKPVLTTTQIINQDKISFCIEQLEKVKNEIIPIFCVPGGIYSNLHNEVFKKIDNEIKQLKEKYEKQSQT